MKVLLPRFGHLHIRFINAARIAVSSVLSIACVFPIFVCGSAQHADAQSNEWAWKGGSSSIPGANDGQAGLYGTLGTAAAGNIPGGRSATSTWTDNSGNLWVFGGYSVDVNGVGAALNDLWKFNPTTNEWTWISGSNATPYYGTPAGVYGTMGTPAAGNTPGGRESAATWVDKNGNLWLFGGFGAQSYGIQTNTLNDLWEFSPSTSLWTWMGGAGPVTYAIPAVYGTMGTPAATNIPGARQGAITWTDSSGNFWLFGGYAYPGYFNDLWMYNPSTNQWTWINGSNTFDNNCFSTQTYSLCGVPGVYGTLGTAAAGNMPGGNEYGSAWTDTSGHVWLFGGYGTDVRGNFGDLNALWQYNPSTNQWTWMGGSTNTATDNGEVAAYGTLGTFAASSVPGAREGAASWTDSSGNFWLFGGSGFDATAAAGSLNDLWEFSPSKGDWAWMGGSNLIGTNLGQPGVYGTLGTANAGNIPGGRQYPVSFTDKSGNFWLIEGQGFDSTDTSGFLNDVWEYQNPAGATTVLSPAATPTFGLVGGTYSGTQSTTISDTIPNAIIYYTTNGTTPTINSTEYSGAIPLPWGGPPETIEAFVTAPGYAPSAIANVVYTITMPVETAVATPTFTPAAGTYSSAQTVTISTTTSGAIIYYTIDGSTPTTTTGTTGTGTVFLYQNGIPISSTGTVNAMATAVNYFNSAVASATFTIAPPAASAIGNWAWMAGSSSIPAVESGQPGVYGTLGTAALGNTPGGRDDGATWTDKNGNLWLFGGFGYDSGGTILGVLNDLWEFNTTTNQWAWMGGSKTIPTCSSQCGQAGVYGTPGTPAAGNIPGARDGAATWTDSNGHLWLYGGFGFDSNDARGYLNDLWEFNPTTNQWAWMGGSSTLGSNCVGTAPYQTCGQPGVYGTPGTAAAGNIPGGHVGGAAWIDSSNNLWFFGGYGFDSTGTLGYLNDVWEFNASSKQWTWMGGSSVEVGGGQPGVYGTLGTAAAANIPGSRVGASTWTDSNGHFWLFGGTIPAVTPEYQDFNDLWEFNPATNQWTWMGGSSTIGTNCAAQYTAQYPTCGQAGVYGTPGSPAAGNVPGGRSGAPSWTDSSGNLWLFGGTGMDSAGSSGLLDDLWSFSPSTKQWTWMGGNNVVGTDCLYGPNDNCGMPGIYGTVGSPAVGNIPGSRDATSHWTDNTGHFWLFGGIGIDANGSHVGFLNDLWEYQPSATIVTTPTAATPTFSVPGGNYSSTQTVTISDTTPNAIIYYTLNGTTPNTNSPVYNSTAITVSSTETIEAIATASGYTQSAVANATYTIGLPAVTLSQTSALTFVSSAGTTSAPQTFTVTNSGTANLSITSITIAGGNSNVFAQTNNCPSTLAPSGVCTVSVTYTPAGEENDASYVSIADNAVSSPQTLEVLGLGSAAAGPGLTISPAGQLRFSALAGATSATQIITIASTGNVNLSINSVSIIGANPADFAQTNNCGNSIAATGLCQISVTFTPAAAQSYSASVSIADNATGSPQSVSLSGTGSATPLATQTQLSSNLSSVTLGTSVNLTAQVSETAGNSIPSGTVTFYDGTTSLGTALLYGNGTAPFITNALAVGTHSITATYGGDVNNAGSTSAAVVVTVNAAAAGSGEWIWTGGNQGIVFGLIFEGPPIPANAPVYGTQGTPSTANLPGNRYGASTWTDSSGNLWLLGGYGYDSTGVSGYLDDLWEYSATAKTWTWVGGSNVVGANDSQFGVYGTQGTAASGNMPGGREYAATWTDNSGRLWLFGGFGSGAGPSTSDFGYLNDLWMYNPSTNLWTWEGGSNNPSTVAYTEVPGVYGTQGTPSTSNIPGARLYASYATDSRGNFWLFGGEGGDSAGNEAELNDLWMFNPSTGAWTWVSGASVVPGAATNPGSGTAGVYGTKGTASSGSVPGSRQAAAAWTDLSGNLWLFGGAGEDSNGRSGELSDLWMFNAANGEWTWVGGSNTVPLAGGNPGVYGTEGTASATNMPGGRYTASAWTDTQGILWLFGGQGFDSVGNYGPLNDLWTYSPSAGDWVWMDGSNLASQSGSYGTLGVASPSNTPGDRNSAAAWTDKSGNFWLYGGDAPGAGDSIIFYYSDLWEYQSPTATITTPVAATPTFSVQGGNYSSTQSVTISDTTPNATIYYTTDGTTPNTNSAAYNGTAITVSSTETIEAIATASGFTQSATASATYAITAPAKTTPTVTVSPSLSSITTALALSVTVTVSGTPTPTGSVVLTSGSYTSAAVTLSSGSATINVPAGSLTKGTDTLTVTYTPDVSSSATYTNATGTNSETVTAPATAPMVTVTPSLSSITSAQAFSVTVTVSGAPTPTGSVALTSGTYTSAPITLSSGSATINVPAGVLATGTDTLTATYTPDSTSTSTYNSSTGTNSVTVTAAITAVAPTVTVTPASSSVTSAQSLSVTISLGGTQCAADRRAPIHLTARPEVCSEGITPTGSVTLTSGTYTSAATTLSNGSATIVIPAGALNTGTDTLTATYTPDANSSSFYTSATGTNSVTVTAAVTANAPTVIVTPASPGITTAQSLSVAIGLAGDVCPGAVTSRNHLGQAAKPETCNDSSPTGTVTLTSGSYTSAATTLTNGSATIIIPAGALVAGTDTLTATYTPDSSSSSTYTSATGTASVVVTTAIVLAPVASLTPPTLTFTATSGTTGTAQTATLTNTGNAALSITSIAITGASSSDYAETNTCGASIAAGASCTISVTFTPASATSLGATLTVTDNAAGSPQSITLSGTGTPLPTFTVSSATPSGTASQTTPATFSITVTPQNGSITSPISFSTTGLPAGYAATFSPPTVTPGSSPATTTLTIQSSSTTLTGALSLATPVLAFLGFCFLPGKRRRRLIAMCLLTVASFGGIATLTGCGGGFAMLKPTQTYTVTITAAGGGQTQTTTVLLTAQE